eukprot:3192524-Amphidinium_carterae.1
MQRPMLTEISPDRVPVQLVSSSCVKFEVVEVSPSGNWRFADEWPPHFGGNLSIRDSIPFGPVSYTHLRAHETEADL